MSMFFFVQLMTFHETHERRKTLHACDINRFYKNVVDLSSSNTPNVNHLFITDQSGLNQTLSFLPRHYRHLSHLLPLTACVTTTTTHHVCHHHHHHHHLSRPSPTTHHVCHQNHHVIFLTPPVTVTTIDTMHSCTDTRTISQSRSLSPHNRFDGTSGTSDYDNITHHGGLGATLLVYVLFAEVHSSPQRNASVMYQLAQSIMYVVPWRVSKVCAPCLQGAYAGITLPSITLSVFFC